MWSVWANGCDRSAYPIRQIIWEICSQENSLPNPGFFCHWPQTDHMTNGSGFGSRFGRICSLLSLAVTDLPIQSEAQESTPKSAPKRIRSLLSLAMTDLPIQSEWSFPRSEKCFRDWDRDRVRKNGIHARDWTVLHGLGPGPGSGCPWSGPRCNGFQNPFDPGSCPGYSIFYMSQKHFSDSVNPPPSDTHFSDPGPGPWERSQRLRNPLPNPLLRKYPKSLTFDSNSTSDESDVLKINVG